MMQPKIRVQFNGKILECLRDISLESSLTDLVTRQFSIRCLGFQDEYKLILKALKSTDRNFIDISILEPSTNKYEPWLRGYLPFCNLRTSGSLSTGLEYTIDGYDIFGALEVSRIVASAIPVPPINIQTVIANILNELNYTTLPKIISQPITIGNKKIIVKTLDTSTGGEIVRNPLSLTNGVANPATLIQIDNGVTDADLVFVNKVAFPRPEDQIAIGAKAFLLNILQFKNLYLLSNGVDKLLLTKPGLSQETIGKDELLYGSDFGTIEGFSKGESDGRTFMRGLPAYNTYCIGQSSLDSSYESGMTESSEEYVSANAYDDRAIPHIQSVHIMHDLPVNKKDLSNLANTIATTRRSIKDQYTYTIPGTFHTNEGKLYEINKFLSINDTIHDYSAEMLISKVRFDYSVTSGAITTITVAPKSSFTDIDVEAYGKIIQKNRKQF